MKFRLSVPIQLLGIIAGVVLFGNYIPLSFTRACYTGSILFKELLGVLLPFMVFFFVMSGILSFRKNAPAMLAVLLGAVFCSNVFVSLISYLFMLIAHPEMSCQTSLTEVIEGVVIEPYIVVSIPVLLNGVHALLAAIALGLFFSFIRVVVVEGIIRNCKQVIEYLINGIFIPLLPIYILGFLLKIKAEGTFSCLMQQYGTAFMSIVILQILYLLWFYFLAAGFSLSSAWQALRTAFPSYIAAFSTMSSTAAIPISVKAAEENTGNRQLADVAMPIMANVHLVGDSVGTPILAMVTMLAFEGALPTTAQYIGFVFYFCLSMFAVSGIPGGGVLVMIPILKSQLGFSSEMISVVMTMYFLMDAFGTSANVMGDGALVIIINKILKRIGITA